MRRAIAFVIMLIVPLQFAWAAAASLHGHAGEVTHTVGSHTHVHDHHENAHPDHGMPGERGAPEHAEDGHHSHVHPVFFPILMVTGLALDIALPGGPILHPPATFLSRTPPLLDRPPLARA